MLVILACYAAGVLSTVRAAFPSQIVVARTADVDSELTAQTEEWAAAQLALLFNLPIVELLPNTTTSSMCSTIAVGYGASVALGLAPEALNSLGADEFKLTTLEHLNSVAVGSAHDSPRGAMYGALELARALGFEIFREGEVAKPAVWPPAAGLPSASGLDRTSPQCPSTRIGLCAGPAQRSFPLINPTWISGNGKRRPSIHVRLSSDVHCPAGM